MKKPTKSLLLIAMLILTLTILAGCGENDSPNQNMPDSTPNSSTPNTTTPNSANLNPPSTSDNDPTLQPEGRSMTDSVVYAKDRSEKLTQAVLDKVSECEDAMVVILGDIAYVSVKIPAEAESQEATELKDKIAQVVTEEDSAISDVYISEDADTFTRIKDAMGSMAEGDIAQGFDEFTNFFTRITPSK